MDFKTTLKDIYSAWLGKNIGIRLGAPVENWTHEQIKNTYGKIERYVCDYEPCFASDDDANGPAFFVRALDYHCSKEISCEELSRQIVNILSEGHGFFWWGGKGIATEHTAYLNLLEGMEAPFSGSAKVNGKALSEQIGGQIFSDCWGYVAYDDPQLASDLAEKMASAMHDLDGIQGARYVAACISLAFTIKDSYQVVLKGLEYIDKTSTYAKLVREIINLYDEKKTQEECLEYILNNHGYDRYEGVCHILPNTAIMIMALLYGENDFSKTMTLLCNAGWDTDCTCGNVGSIMGALVGVDAIDSKWILPIKDRFIGSSLIGSWNIDTLSHQAYYFTSLAFQLRGIQLSDTYYKYLNSSIFTFELPYGVQGFECNTNRYFESNLIQKENTLTCIINNAYQDQCLKIYKKTYYRPCDLYDTRYQPSFSPILYPNETITFRCLPYQHLELRIYAVGRDHIYTGEWTQSTNLSLTLPSNDDVILEIGVELKAKERILHETFQIQEVCFDQKINCILDFRKEKMNDYGLDYGGEVFQEINQCTTLRQKSGVDCRGLHIENDMVVFGHADSSLKEMTLVGKYDDEIEICFDVTGRLNYQAIVLQDEKIVIKNYKSNKKVFTTEQKICKMRTDEIFTINIVRKEEWLDIKVNDQVIRFACEKGKGALGVKTSHSATLTWCQFVMDEFS